MLKAFMNEVFWDTNPLSAAYVEKTMSYLDILDVISVYSKKFEDCSTVSLAQWCTKNGMRIMDAARCRKTRKSNDNKKQTYLEVYMLKKEFHGKACFRC